MKNYLLGLVAMAIAVAGVAFTNPAKKADKPSAIIYFHYTGTTFSETDFENSSFWATTPASTDGTLCNGGTDPCIVPIEQNDIPRHGSNTLAQDFALKLATIGAPTNYAGYSTASAYVNGTKTDSKN